MFNTLSMKAVNISNKGLNIKNNSISLTIFSFITKNLSNYFNNNIEKVLFKLISSIFTN